MAETHDNTLRALMRLIPPARALKEDLEQKLHLELYADTGDMAVKNFQGLHASVAQLTDDPYFQSLSLEVPENASDKGKVSLVLSQASQLLAYLEGQTGFVGLGANSHIEYHLAPHDIEDIEIDFHSDKDSEETLSKTLNAFFPKAKTKTD